MARSVLLKHSLPDGSFHFDWMIERGGSLITFRLDQGIESGALRDFEATRLSDHRVAYLEYEGEVSGGRGEVSRVASGTMAILVDSAAELIAEGAIGNARGRFEGRLTSGDRWEFRIAKTH